MKTIIKQSLRRFYKFFDPPKSSRSEFWIFFLFLYMGLAIPFLLAYLFSNTSPVFAFDDDPIMWIFILYSIYMQVALVCAIIRRLSDAGYSGAWILVTFVPVVGMLILLFLLCRPTKVDDPKAEEQLRSMQ